MRLVISAALVACSLTFATCFEDQVIINLPQSSDHGLHPARGLRRLHGRFLHITDFHPDPFYRIFSSSADEDACHRGKGSAGVYGAEMTDCDSPFALINKTMEFIAREIRDKIDFVVWTGDSARHDNDEMKPRNRDQVLGLNRFLLHNMAEVFGKHNGDERDGDPNNDFIIPIIPTLGNNDILPHNILAKGPNQWTRAYASLWKQLIPEAQQHSFQQGGWFYVEVIPNELAVFSLNTMYFFSSNSAADGCAARSEPGYRQMEWLRIQLQFMRDRGVKAILTGHVPPVRQEAKTSWDETCWQKYTLWMRQYRDVIVGGLYGHFNYDHFLFQDSKQLDKDTKKGRMRSYDSSVVQDGSASVMGKTSYFLQLRDEWASIPSPPPALSLSWLQRLLEYITRRKKKNKDKSRKKYLEEIGGEFAERFSATFVSASVVPNLFPTLRVFEYNITGLDHSRSARNDLEIPVPVLIEHFDADSPFQTMKKSKRKKHKFTVPEPPSKSTPPGPAYSPQSCSLIKYTQYYANLTQIRSAKSLPGSTDDLKSRELKYEILYDTQDDKIYRLRDLTIPSMIGLAQRIGQFVADPQQDEEHRIDAVSNSIQAVKRSRFPMSKGYSEQRKRKHWKQNEPWYTFVSRAFVDTMSLEEIEEEFG